MITHNASLLVLKPCLIWACQCGRVNTNLQISRRLLTSLVSFKKVPRNWSTCITFESKLLNDSLFASTTSLRNLLYQLLESSRCWEEIYCFSCKWSTNFPNFFVEASGLRAMLHETRAAADLITIDFGGLLSWIFCQSAFNVFLYSFLNVNTEFEATPAFSTFLSSSFAAEPNFTYKKNFKAK